MTCFLFVDPIGTCSNLFICNCAATMRFHSWVNENLIENRYSHIKKYEYRTKCKRSFLVPDFQHVSYLYFFLRRLFTDFIQEFHVPAMKSSYGLNHVYRRPRRKTRYGSFIWSPYHMPLCTKHHIPFQEESHITLLQEHQ